MGEKSKKIVDNKEVIPLQVDYHKCGLDHFYYNMTPKNKAILEVWNRIKDKNMNLHNLGKDIISKMKSDDYDVIDKYTTEEEIFRDLINEFNIIINMAKKLDDSSRNVY